MKGIIFTEFLEMVDISFSRELTEKLLSNCELASGGAYTRVGTYDHSEMIALVSQLHKETGVPISDLVKAYGQYLLNSFSTLYPEFFSNCPDLFDFLEHVDSYIHVEVKMLYPDAQLPELTTERSGDDSLFLTYRSSRHLGDVAEGLIQGAITHYGSHVVLTRQDINEGEDQCVQFKLTMTETPIN